MVTSSPPPPQTVLVTGSMGYIGSRLTRVLRERGFRCLGYDAGWFQDCLLYAPEDPQTIRKDLRDLEPRDLDGVDAVIHLAGISNDPVGTLKAERLYGPTRAYTVQLAQWCQARGLRFIFASSCSVYGIGGGACVTEESATNPQTGYARHKLEIERDLQGISGRNFRPILLRLATVFGASPRVRFDVLVNMLVGMAVSTGRILLNSNGQAWRPHVHIEDVCEAFVQCLGDPPQGEQPLVLNVGDDGLNCQVREVAALVRGMMPGSRIELLHGRAPRPSAGELDDIVRDRKVPDGIDARTYRVSFQRIRQVLPGFRCRWTLAAGIEDMIRTLRAVGLTERQFTDERFYRLKRLDSLFRSGDLTEEARWTSRGEPLAAAT